MIKLILLGNIFYVRHIHWTRFHLHVLRGVSYAMKHCCGYVTNTRTAYARIENNGNVRTNNIKRVMIDKITHETFYEMDLFKLFMTPDLHLLSESRQ